ncbi:ATP-dependent Clp protease ATP-binding subunit [Brevibacillus fluminis]|uniref:ATP-dependent Clp protease ATP-binding subunit n=1 Tax=Brevibacillus fluminis TaxID=511487 RepID=A0A3M8DA97_9BACL|nr:AAA family ATPase [Brevibacillus fluminis]RNB84509.1 ATP-dependent Clp protease ATP-binding subunit [Brevibacillus fluminis]
MPFINDKLEYLTKKQEEQLAERAVARELEGQQKSAIKTRFRFEVPDVLARMRSRIIGQEHALAAIENMLKVVKTDISDPEKPLYVGLLLGPTGVGKTETVRVLAEAIHGKRNSFCRVDMNTLSLDHYAAALTGAPPGYVGSKEGATVLDKELIEGTFSKPGLILFDEIEKASDQVFQTLLNIFDNGLLRSTTGQDTINFRNTIILMTSNLGAREMDQFTNSRVAFLLKTIGFYVNPSNWGKQGTQILDGLIKKKLEQTFKPEFINRIDERITFKWLERNRMEEIVETFAGQLGQRLQRHGCSLQLERSAVDFLIENGFDKRYGARAIRRAMKQHIELPVAELLLASQVDMKNVVLLARKGTDGSRINITAERAEGLENGKLAMTGEP